MNETVLLTDQYELTMWLCKAGGCVSGEYWIHPIYPWLGMVESGREV